MKKICAATYLILILAFAEVYGQVKFAPENDFSVGFSSVEKSFLYQKFSNPALLFEDWRDEVLYIRSEANSANGDFKPFVAPGRTTFLAQSASGKKQIDSLQIFRGSFQIQQQIRKKWNWFATRDYLFGMPFLLGDSSRGDTRYNGIAMTAEYCRKINRFHLGASLDYFVDEGLKRVSPKPTSKHRDIVFRAGTAFQPAKKWQLSALFTIIDKQEEIYYREDKSSYYQATTLFIFRGYDFPLVFNKNTETRYGYFNEYGFATTAKYFAENGSWLTAYFENRLQQNDIKDNTVNPQNQGYWQNIIYEFGFDGKLGFSRFTFTGGYSYKTESSWAKHPDFRTLLTETDVAEHQFTAGALYRANSRVSFGAEGKAEIRDTDYRDHYSAVAWAARRNYFEEKLGIQVRWRPALFTFFSVGAMQGFVSDKSLTEASHSGFWLNRRADVEYFLTESRGYRADFDLLFYVKFLGFVQYHFGWQRIAADDNSYFQNKIRDYFSTGITLQLKAY